jgi:DNA-binding MarR family transcriptional regulator
MKEKLTNVLHEIVWLMDKYANKALQQKYNISFAKFHVLIVIEKTQPTNQAQVARHLHYTQAAISKALSKLMQEELIDIRIDPTHARRNIVHSTKKGSKLAKACSKFLDKEFDGLLKNIDISKKAYYENSIKIRNALDRPVNKASH